MKKIGIIFIIVAIAICSFTLQKKQSVYHQCYDNGISDFYSAQISLIDVIKNTDISTQAGRAVIKRQIALSRRKLKAVDLWTRYLDPVVYNKLNGPLAVEWENEVFEKFEKPYRREGAGLSLAELYLDNKSVSKDTLLKLIQSSVDATATFKADSIVLQLDTFDNFFFANRLFLLNLAAIYTTGFECPDKSNIIPELRDMLASVNNIYVNYNESFPETRLTKEYLELYAQMIDFVNRQPVDFQRFNNLAFIKDHVNPLFAINQQLINKYNATSRSFNDYTLNNDSRSIFDKALYAPQNTKGIYSLVQDRQTLEEIKQIGKLLFYDPILSGNNERSCVSCHKPTEYFTDTARRTAFAFNRDGSLPRNTPSLINVVYNHLLMLDGKHISLQNQAKDVMSNPREMGCSQHDLLEKVLSCADYKKAFKKFLKFTPEEPEISLDHIISAITYYYSDFSNYYSPFDDAMNANKPLTDASINGFNLFMGKAQCGTCHFVPQFNGVKPPYISSEFEILGVPEDKDYKALSIDSGRYLVNPAPETFNAFRTGSIRNAEFTHPYMHNGVFNTLEEVVDFYDAGGGAGRNLQVKNQTLSSDSLKLTISEKRDLISFIHSLNEDIVFPTAPAKLPASSRKELNDRRVGGEY